MKRELVVLCCCAVFLLFVCLAFGQGGRGTINGTVQDPSGALIAGAQVSVKNLLTGAVTMVPTSDGHYSAPFLPPGKYEISISKQGFATQTETGLVLDTDQVASVNFTLRPG